MKFLVLVSASVALVVAVLVLNPDHQWRWSLWRSPVADLVVRNAKIYTSDESLPFADSMAVRNGSVLRVGNYSSVQMQDMVGYRTKELDLMGKIVVPGFIDSHVHLIFGGLQMGRVELRGISQKEEFLKMVKEAVRNAKQGSWILGGGWNNDFWGGELPAASWIDDTTPYNPVWLSRMDGHMGLANSVALKLAGITNSSEDPVGGTIMKTTGGENRQQHVWEDQSIIKWRKRDAHVPLRCHESVEGSLKYWYERNKVNFLVSNSAVWNDDAVLGALDSAALWVKGLPFVKSLSGYWGNSSWLPVLKMFP